MASDTTQAVVTMLGVMRMAATAESELAEVLLWEVSLAPAR